MTFSRQELLELQNLLEHFDKVCWKCGFVPDQFPRPSITSMLKRIKQEVLLHA